MKMGPHEHVGTFMQQAVRQTGKVSLHMQAAGLWAAVTWGHGHDQPGSVFHAASCTHLGPGRLIRQPLHTKGGLALCATPLQ